MYNYECTDNQVCKLFALKNSYLEYVSDFLGKTKLK